MKKIIIAVIVSLGLGVGATYAVMNKTITEQAKTISTLNTEIDHLNNAVELKEMEYQELSAENKRLFEDRNAGVLFGMKLCKKMKDERSCLMELGIKTRSTIDFKE
ncbi:hypothetical protein OGT86_000301 [Salmonella enterica]|nr:hypothetical protein [Salmonella enterica]EIK6302942.1 hypothetical protein [Salmonella enterica]EJY6537479.1 hypothetical protein [Salmonella enterica]EKP8984758.1 hypothetical protein [Salmonella enterica]